MFDSVRADSSDASLTRRYTRSGIVVATGGSLKKSGAMGAAVVAKDGRIQARSAAVFGQQSSIRPELTGIALALGEAPSSSPAPQGLLARGVGGEESRGEQL